MENKGWFCNFISFFRNNLPSVLGHSNSNAEDRLALRRQNIPFTAGRLRFLLSGIETPAYVLESVAVKSTTGILGSGEISIPINDSGSGLENTGTMDRFDTLTEILGFESSADGGKGRDPTTPLLAGSIKRSRETMPNRRREGRPTPKNFPPFLSTLKENGRPRFDMRKERKDGRLRIETVRNYWPDVVRTSGGDCRIRMQIFDAEKQDEEEEEAMAAN